ncbi:hypothetical protein H0H93_013362 [Arthromyces matolae]|nr:hypothetical protein H0H93_013362 [Arthromyces matolae]
MKCFLGPYTTIVLLALTASVTPLPAPAKSSLSAGRIDPDNSLSAPHNIFPDPNSSRTGQSLHTYCKTMIDILALTAAGDHAIALASRSDQNFNTQALLKGAHVAEDTPVDAYQHLIDDYRQRQQTVNNMATVLALQEALALLFLKEKQVNPYWNIRRQIEEVRDRKVPREEPQIQEYAKEISLRLRAVLVERQQKEPLVVSAVALAFELQYTTGESLRIRPFT